METAMNRTLSRALATALAALVTLVGAGCTLTLDPDQYAPKTSCPPGQKVCGYKCVPLDDPATGCASASCEPCSPGPNATAACGTEAGTPTYGQCISQCDVGWGDCNAAVEGCETRVNDTNNCGACGRFCIDGLGCDSSGYCTPTGVAIGPSPGQIRGLVADPVNSSRVYYASDGYDTFLGGNGVIGSVDAVTSTGGPYINSQPLGPVSCLAGSSSQLFFCVDGIPSQVGLLASYAPGTLPEYPPVLSGPAGTGGMLAPSIQGLWWVPPGGMQLIWSNLTSAVAAPFTSTGGWRAIATDRYTGMVYFADDEGGGRILSIADGPSPTSANDVGSGAGEVGAIAVRGSGIKEIYWGDLATGNVMRQVNGVRTVIYRGAGRTTRMRMVADDQGVYWLDETARTVMEYLPGSVYGEAVIPLSLGKTPIELAVGIQRIFWTGPDTRDLHSTQR
jgi:hypothetical protein